MKLDISAVVYTSNTGFTAKYAALLAEAIHLPFYDLKQAQSKLPSGARIFYLGWIMGGKLKGLDKALRRFQVVGAGAVGLSENCDLAELSKNNPGACPLFYLRGGFDPSRLRGMYKLLIGAMEKFLPQSDPDSPSGTETLEAMRRGGDWVSLEQLAPVLTWLEGDRD